MNVHRKQNDSICQTAFAALQEAVSDVHNEHSRTGEPLAIVRDGQSQLIPPSETITPPPGEIAPLHVAEEPAKYHKP